MEIGVMEIVTDRVLSIIYKKLFCSTNFPEKFPKVICWKGFSHTHTYVFYPRILIK